MGRKGDGPQRDGYAGKGMTIKESTGGPEAAAPANTNKPAIAGAKKAQLLHHEGPRTDSRPLLFL